jgi:hypothetical protein
MLAAQKAASVLVLNHFKSNSRHLAHAQLWSRAEDHSADCAAVLRLLLPMVTMHISLVKGLDIHDC